MDNPNPVRYWQAEFNVYGPGLSQAQMDAILDAVIAAVEGQGALMGGGFVEVNADGEALK
jgi:hypothetical protein